eukprot:1196414-Prorocentrum_minimum.AAC.4
MPAVHNGATAGGRAGGDLYHPGRPPHPQARIPPPPPHTHKEMYVVKQPRHILESYRPFTAGRRTR